MSSSFPDAIRRAYNAKGTTGGTTYLSVYSSAQNITYTNFVCNDETGGTVRCTGAVDADVRLYN